MTTIAVTLELYEPVKAVLDGPPDGVPASVLTQTPFKMPIAVVVGGKGDKGDKGDTGENGTSGAGYTHTQASASAVWTINHNLGFRPTVYVIDSAGSDVEGSVVHTSLNQVVITFSGAFSGYARLT